MNIHDAERVIVVSDAHGHVELIENALGHAGFDAAWDGLIYAGDLVDGDATRAEVDACIALLKDQGAQFLWGNHDVAVLLDYCIPGQDSGSRHDFTQRFGEEFHSEAHDRWRLVVRVQGVFVSHAGLSTDYLNDYLYADKSHRVVDPDGFVERLNRMFDLAAQRQLASGERDKLARIMGRRSPHRFRPFEDAMCPDCVLHVTQIAGHSPPERYGSEGYRRSHLLAEKGLHIIDPDYGSRRGTEGFRYGVIVNGRVEVVDESSEGRDVLERNS